MPKAVRVVQVSKIYPLGQTQVQALTDVNIEIEEGEFLTIAGPSGCGNPLCLIWWVVWM